MNAVVYVSKYDLKLLEAAQAGDQQAILALLVAAKPDIRRYAQRSCSASEEIDDVVQETLWLLYRRLGTLRALNSLSAWLLTVVRRECIRAAQRLIGKPVDLDEAVRDPSDARHFARPSEDALRVDVANAIQSLPEHYRRVVMLRDIEEMTVDEIAARLALSREAVKGRLHRARVLLREYLTD